MAFGAPARVTALGAALLNVAVTAWLFIGFQYGNAAEFQFAASRPILDNPKMGFNVGVDGMSLVLVLLTALVTLAAVWLKPAKAEDGDALYYASSLLIAAGAMGAFVATDIFFFYAFHELALIPTFLMIGMRGTGENKEAAWKITIYLGLGSLVLLAGIAALVLNNGGGPVTFDMAELRSITSKLDPVWQSHVYLTLLLGFGALISLFPFHSWAAPAYASAPAPTAMLHAGVLKKFGLYGLLRVAQPMLPAGAQTEWIHNLLLLLLLGNILYVGYVTIAQRELDLVLGNSSVMHMGYVFLGIASGTAIGYSGAVLLMFAHGVSIALLFALTASIREKAGTLELARLGGMAQRTPFLGLAFAMAAFASIGLPGFANFASELMVFFGGFANKPAEGLDSLQVATIFAFWGVVISAVYMLRAFRAIFQGDLAPTVSAAEDLAWPARLPALLLLAALLVVGFFPNLLLNAVRPVVEAIAAAR